MYLLAVLIPTHPTSTPTMISALSSAFLLAAAPLAVSAYNDCTGMIGTSTLSVTTLAADGAANGPPFQLDFADTTVPGSPLVVLSGGGGFYTTTCGDQEYAYPFDNPAWASSSIANTPAFFPSVTNSSLCITAQSLTDKTTILVSAICDPDNEPGQLFQMTEGDFVDTALQLIGSQAMPTYLNNTSYSAALVSNGSSPKYVEITYNKDGVSPITPSDTSIILTLSDD
ncbi:hypothetical protein FIBSPDRAFT_1048927 [Athelia psychrophila]|uniref:Uncharacterized protein n=1 Tax=Athelia psychrophila TaxID=1759441 RepID=A0A166CZ54_9AGAM|nr:hypothetical protein FIBSPDRAFT_1048927 [Fibularhizoctonia sp. CBS 109695]